jgi:hypothetical protein
MVAFLRINVDQNLTVYYFNNGHDQYPSNLVIYQPNGLKEETEKAGKDKITPESIRQITNHHLNGLYTHCQLSSLDAKYLNNPAIHSCLWAGPSPVTLLIDGLLELELGPSQLVILENMFRHRVELKNQQKKELYHLYYFQKPVIKLKKKT